MRDLWLAFKLHRFEVLSVTVLSLGLAAAAVILARILGDPGPARCIEDRMFPPVPPECAHTEEFIFVREQFGGPVMAAMVLVPFVAGALLGVPVVARGIEHRTASLPWSLSGSRMRWLVRTAVPLALILTVLLSILSLAASFLGTARIAGADPAATFGDYGLRGPLIVLRGLLAFSIAVLAGALLGRVLPGLIVAAVGGILAFNFLLIARPFGQPIERLPDRPSYVWGLTDLYMREDAPILVSEGEEQPRPAQYGVPAERMREVEARESIVLVLGFVVLAGVSLAVVDRRRPY